MNKEIRKELAILRKHSRVVDQQLVAQCRTADREIKRLEKLIFRQKKTKIRAMVGADRAWDKIDRRIAILEGRLS